MIQSIADVLYRKSPSVTSAIKDVLLQDKKRSRTAVGSNPIATTHYKVELLLCIDFEIYEKYDLFTNTLEGPSTGLLGLAWVKAICYKVRYNAYYENSIVEDKGKAIVGLVAAHELGHKVDRNCMASLSPNHDPLALDKYNNTLHGQIYNHDEQCMQNRNHEDTYLCRHYLDPTTVCKYMYCKIPGTGSCSIHIPWEGTVCGDGKNKVRYTLSCDNFRVLPYIKQVDLLSGRLVENPLVDIYTCMTQSRALSI
ncbi:unnamed protein product [Mytilus edulis]|uniref:ADAMTS cysteine-rich domain-containing protein n=1 Tax=Mytilus edulis TaxID=6550 RepID=A0A8S3PVI6_MYTED|nr:unnamed protein product [Mytilus edulis]